MTRLPAFSSPLLLGFDEIERLLEKVAKSAEGYPPFNIERISANGVEHPGLRITLAVAGFAPNEIEVTVEENELTIVGRQSEDPERIYLHRGIAARQFRRTFVLADGMEVTGAALEDGLLSIELERPEAARRIRRIPIVLPLKERRTT